MTRRYKITRREQLLRSAAPEQLLLLTIFGSEQIRCDVECELDRRAFDRRGHAARARIPSGGGNRAA